MTVFKSSTVFFIFYIPFSCILLSNNKLISEFTYITHQHLVYEKKNPVIIAVSFLVTITKVLVHYDYTIIWVENIPAYFIRRCTGNNGLHPSISISLIAKKAHTLADQWTIKMLMLETKHKCPLMYKFIKMLKPFSSRACKVRLLQNEFRIFPHTAAGMHLERETVWN